MRATKQFKPGEWAMHPTWKINATDNGVKVSFYNWDGEMVQVQSFFPNELDRLELALEEDGTPFWASKVMEWLDTKGMTKPRQRFMQW